MSLPIIGVPHYETKIPSTGETVKFRPFLVKEEKILLLAMETGDKKAQYRALKQILTNCIQNKINVNKLAAYDVEYLFIQIRGKSVGEVLDPIVVCPSCKTQGKLKINLSDVEIKKNEQVELPYRVMFTDKVGITLIYPNLEIVENTDPGDAVGKANKGDSDTIFKIIVKCIDTIFDGEQTFNPSDYSEKQLAEFIEGVPTEAFKKVIDFISDMPRVQKDVKFRCPFCSFEKDITLKGIEDFFGTVSPTIA